MGYVLDVSFGTYTTVNSFAPSRAGTRYSNFV